MFFFYWYVYHQDLHVLTHPFPTRLSSDLWPSTHEVRNAGVDVDREVHQQAHHQPAENAEADENAQKLWHKAERRLVDGGRGLHHAQQHADGERGDDDGGRDQHQYPERLTRDGSEICCVQIGRAHV